MNYMATSLKHVPVQHKLTNLLITPCRPGSFTPGQYVYKHISYKSEWVNYSNLVLSMVYKHISYKSEWVNYSNRVLSMVCARWCIESGFIWYCRTWQTFGWSFGWHTPGPSRTALRSNESSVQVSSCRLAAICSQEEVPVLQRSPQDNITTNWLSNVIVSTSIILRFISGKEWPPPSSIKVVPDAAHWGTSSEFQRGERLYYDVKCMKNDVMAGF